MEMLCVCVVLVLLSAALVLGVQLAVKSFNSSMAGAEAQELCATLTELVSDELRYARDVTSAGGELRFFSVGYGGGEDGGGLAFHTTEDGVLCLGDNPVAGAASYSAYRLSAALTLTYAADSGWFDAQLTVTDSKGTPLAENAFRVRQLLRT